MKILRAIKAVYRQESFPWILFITQQVAVPLASVLSTVALAVLLRDTLPESWVALNAVGLLVYFSPALFGFIFGVIARNWGASVRQTGRRIWIAPLALFAFAFASELGFGWRNTLHGFFGFRGGETEEGVGALLVTFPTAACCCYSLGVSLRKSVAKEVRS